MSFGLCRRRVYMYVVRVNVAQVNVIRYTVGVPCQLSNYLAFLFNIYHLENSKYSHECRLTSL